VNQPIDPEVGGRRPWIAVVVSLLAHVALLVALHLGFGKSGAGGGEPFAVDVEVAPEAPQAELLPAEQLAKQEEVHEDDVVVPEPPPTPAPAPAPEEPDDEAVIAADAGVADAPPAKEPRDAATTVADEERDAGVDDGGVAKRTSDGGAMVASGGVADGGVPSATMGEEGATGAGASGALGPTGPVNAGSAANLLAYFPKNHIVTVLIRFDRLRGTEWAKVAQDVLSVMPDFTTLVADPSAVVADKIDLIAVSTPKPRDVRSTLIAIKPAMPMKDLRTFLDAPGAPVTWLRVSGGVEGKRGAGERVFPKDPRVFLAPFPNWMVLARAKDLPGLLDPAEGDLEGAVADRARLPDWLRRIPDLEAESGIPNGPALMMTLAPRRKRWEVPDVGLGVTSLPAPERMTLSLEIDRKGFLVRGNLRFASEADAITFMEKAQAARQAALDSAAHAAILRRTHGLNAVKGLSLARTDRRVTYATSISIADARILMAAGTLAVADYFESGGEDE